MNQLPLWLNPRWWCAREGDPLAPRPGGPERDAEQRWENEGGNPPMGEPPDANPDKQL